MKLFWKIFLSVITMTVFIFSISGHLLISRFFTTSLDKKVDSIKMLHNSVYRSLEETLIDEFGYKMWSEGELEETAERMGLTEELSVEELSVEQIWIFDGNLQTVYKMNKESQIAADKLLLEEVNRETDSYEVQNKNETYYLKQASVELVNGQDLYMESISDVTVLFAQKEEQYRIYMSCMLILIAVTAVLVLLLTLWIVAPIKKLSKTVQMMAAGELSKRVHLKGNDEICMLAKEVNQMAEQLERNIEELQDAADRQEMFTSSFAHELKTPLTSIIGYADILYSKKTGEEDRIRYSGYILQQGKRLEALFKKMMDLIILKKKETDMKEIRIDLLLATVREEMLPILKERNIDLEIHVEECSVCADEDLLKTVFVNLIDNGIKAIGEEGNIQVESERQGKMLCISVSDNGKGIPQKDIKRVTESFYMVDKSRKYNGGVGLGLTICKQILDLHHASMKLESKEHEGTRITICFEVEP